jgi:hypothetical protein
MKTAGGIVALLLGLLTLLRGYSGASQGDPFGAILNIADQQRTLIANAKDARWSAWACLIGTVLASIVCAVVPSKTPAATSPVASVSRPAPPVTFQAEHTVEERLRTLLQLRETGFITDGEYQVRTREIVEQI